MLLRKLLLRAKVRITNEKVPSYPAISFSTMDWIVISILLLQFYLCTQTFSSLCVFCLREAVCAKCNQIIIETI